MAGLTKTMYAIALKVAKPARTSVFQSAPSAWNSKYRSSLSRRGITICERATVAHALLRAASSLDSTLCSLGSGRRHECRRCTQECVRHNCLGLALIALRGQFGDSGNCDVQGLRRRPVAALDDGRRFVGLAFGEAALFAACGPQQVGADHGGDHAAQQAELAPDVPAHRAHLFGHYGIRAAEVVLHGPERGSVAAAQRTGLAGEALADARIGVVLVAPVAVQGGAADAVDAGTVAFG